jgi:hypothetical protein
LYTILRRYHTSCKWTLPFNFNPYTPKYKNSHAILILKLKYVGQFTYQINTSTNHNPLPMNLNSRRPFFICIAVPNVIFLSSCFNMNIYLKWILKWITVDIHGKMQRKHTTKGITKCFSIVCYNSILDKIKILYPERLPVHELARLVKNSSKYDLCHKYQFT